MHINQGKDKKKQKGKKRRSSMPNHRSVDHTCHPEMSGVVVKIRLYKKKKYLSQLGLIFPTHHPSLKARIIPKKANLKN
jgi:hypothetical protein